MDVEYIPKDILYNLIMVSYAVWETWPNGYIFHIAWETMTKSYHTMLIDFFLLLFRKMYVLVHKNQPCMVNFVVARTFRSQYNSYPRQLVPKTTRTQDDLYPK